MRFLQAVIEGLLNVLLTITACFDWFNHHILRQVAFACRVKRPRDFSCPQPAERLHFKAATTLSRQLLDFQSKLHRTEFQHGTQRGDGDPMLYLYMERALRADPSLAAHVTRNRATACIPDDELFAIPARDTYVKGVMYNRLGCTRGVFPPVGALPADDEVLATALGRCLDLRDWAATLAALAKTVSNACSVCPGSSGAADAAPRAPEQGPLAANKTPPIGLASWLPTEAFDSNPIFSFSGAAWLIVYHIGAASALQERWSLAAPSARLCGTSSGSVVAACAGSGLQMSDMLVRSFEKWLLCNERVCGPVGAMGTLVQEAMQRHVEPAGGHKCCSDRVKIAVTPLQAVHAAHAGENEVFPVEDAGALFHAGLQAGWLHSAHVSHFETAEALTNAVLASCYIPVYSDVPGKVLRSVCHSLQPEAWAARRAAAGLATVRPSAATHDREEEPHLVCWDGGLSSNYPRWFGQGELREMRKVVQGGFANMNRFTVTVSPTAGDAAISPGQAMATAANGDGSCVAVGVEARGDAASDARDDNCPATGGAFAGGRGFVVDSALCSSGWGPDETLFPMTPERWWHVFFAGRGHAQAWMAKHGFEPASVAVNS